MNRHLIARTEVDFIHGVVCMTAELGLELEFKSEVHSAIARAFKSPTALNGSRNPMVRSLFVECFPVTTAKVANARITVTKMTPCLIIAFVYIIVSLASRH